MKLCVSHVYWMLLFTSVVSSTLLFLIVATENIQNNKFIGPDRNEIFKQQKNVTFSDNSEEYVQSEEGSQESSNIELSSSVQARLDKQHFQDVRPPISSNLDSSNKNENHFSDEIEIFKESLSQPNLSQEISDGKQAVVLTLVKTASSLQSLTAGRPDFHSQSVLGEGNATKGPTPEDDTLGQPRGLVGFPKLLEVNESSSNDSRESTGYFEEDADNVVVVVRAEQKSPSSVRVELELEREGEKENGSIEEPQRDEVEEDVSSQQLQKSQTTASDLNDSVARARLTGSVDDSAAVILESFVTAGPSDTHEEIPSFNEWAQKRLEEVEKKKAHPNASVQTANGSPGRGLGNMRMRSKNYASPDCGAKVVAANPESRSARSILVSTRDEYMLNTCTSRVWFVVELCEAIQAKKIDLANFELFSSSPKDLSVYVSDRFPTRDWSIVGQFSARDERDVQSFSLQPHLFGKFIKVELHSHYGSEHFCPISLFRAYGTSEFEVLETETETDSHDDNQRHESSNGGKIDTGSDAENEDEDDEDVVFEEEEDSTTDRRSHLFGSARDAVISIVKKAAEALVKNDDLKSDDNATDTENNGSSDELDDPTINECASPVYNVVCRDCDEDRFSRIYQLVSCKRRHFESLLNSMFVRQILDTSRLCDDTFEFGSSRTIEQCTDNCKALDGKNTFNQDIRVQFLASFFDSNHVVALCNVLAAKTNRLFVNVTRYEQRISDRTTDETRIDQNSQTLLPTKDERFASTRPIDVMPTLDNDKTKVEVPVIKSKMEVATESQIIENFATQIKPTKTTVMNDEIKKQSFVSNLESSRSQPSEDYEVYQFDNSIVTDSPVSVVTKRISINLQKASSGSASQESVQCSQEGSSQQDIPILGTASKLPQNLESNHKLNQKNVNIENSEVEAESEEEIEVKTKVEGIEQDSKTMMQDQLNFENFDFKDLDVEGLQSNGGMKNDASITQQTTSATSPQQKESVFLRLSNRIKALERNMSLSSQYLEELSRRYKKQVEEMQRSLERSVTAMSEETRKGEERENKRLEEVTALRKQIDNLAKTLDVLVYERNSWRISFSSLMHHALFVFVDVVLVILILSYCRRADDDLDYLEEEGNERTILVKRARGTNYEIAKQQCTQMTKKPKKRRPSEIASQVSGTYDQLMIEDSLSMNQMSRRDRRKKRKKDSIVLRASSIKDTKSCGKGDGDLQNVTTRLSTLLPSRSSSANDALYMLERTDDRNYSMNGSRKHRRPGSAPDNSIDYFGNSLLNQQTQFDRKVQILSMETNHDRSVDSNEKTLVDTELLDTSMTLEDDTFEVESSTKNINTKTKKLSSPSFIKTALASRSKRISFSGNSKKKQSQKLEDNVAKPVEKIYNAKLDLLNEIEYSNGPIDEHNNGRTTNGHVDESDESRSSSATPTVNWNKKEKKTNGLKKMVRKFF